MCGINGIFAYGKGAPAPDEKECIRVRDAMRARGPDGEGLYRDPEGRLLFGHRRLAIIDLAETGAQPMSTPDGQLTVTFNGEIYNYQSLRESLETQGVRLETESDTEVLLHLYRRHGVEMIEHLEGMFAFAIWDRESASLLLARDPHGIKPLYLADDGQSLRFASSVRALLAGGAVSRDPDPLGMTGFLSWGSVPEPRTIFRAVEALPAGSLLKVSLAGVGEPQSYWHPSDAYREGSRQGAGAAGRDELDRLTRSALMESVTRHLVADVPVGLFLSSGVDSATLLALATEAGGKPVHTVTLAFQEFQGDSQDEAPLAEVLASRYGARHQTVMVSASEVRSRLPEFIEAMDQPTIDGLNVYLVSRAVREAGLKAALSGLGGDEIFGGYPSFRRFPWLLRLSPLGRIPLMATFSRRLLTRLLPARQRGKFRTLPDALRHPSAAYHLVRGLFTERELEALLSGGAQETQGDGSDGRMSQIWTDRMLSPWSRIAIAEQCLYMRNQLLRDADWASMAHGLEVRVPLVDRRLSMHLASRVASSGGRWKKQPLAAAARPALPAEILARPKTGFGLPLQAWVGEDCQRGWRPSLPVGFLDARNKSALDDLARGVTDGTVHWSRIWALRVLGEYLEGCQA